MLREGCEEFENEVLAIIPNKTVEMPPPMNPSHVFFGDSLISGVLPKKNPNTYAMTSFATIMLTGTMNLNNEGVRYTRAPRNVEFNCRSVCA